jgi:hypothetical protein
VAKKSSTIQPGVELSPFTKNLIAAEVAQAMPAPVTKTVKKTAMAIIDPFEDKDDGTPPTLAKSILNVMNGPGKASIERLAFEQDPRQNQYQGLFKQKLRLLPDSILKRIQIQDDLVATIINTRANQISAFGRPRPDRFTIGYVIEPEDEGLYDRLEDSEANELRKAIARAERRFLSCGSIAGWHDKDRMTFAQYLYSSTKNAVGLGRIATEIVWATNVETGKEEFHSFRPIDAGTIYRAAPQREAAQAVRDQAKNLLEQLKNEKLKPERFEQDEYAWVQVIEGRPIQAFTSREVVCHNFYPSNDVELEGYPITPLDTVISAVTMHINITSHNKLYFQSGRASRGMLVIESDDVDENVIGQIRQQFNASINSVTNAWRMPVFGVGVGDKISWQPIDSGQRDMEFQYLSDTNARVILSAFQMSPEELPGYAHLSRGTNSQALSESNQEYLLIAHRDVGIRPLIKQWEDFLNASIFPLIDEKLAKICRLKLVGLDAESAEKESIRITQDAPIHMTQDEIQHKVEKKPLGKEWGGEIPLSPTYQAILDKYFTVGQILERFCGIKGAAKDPNLQYRRDAFFFQWLEFQQQQQQMAMQQQQAQQQAAQGGGPPSDGGGGGGGGGDGGGGGSPPPSSGDDSSSSSGGDSQSSTQDDDQKAAQTASEDMSRAIDGAQQALGKSEKQLDANQKKLLARQKAVVSSFMSQWKDDSEEAIREIAAAAMSEGE